MSQTSLSIPSGRTTRTQVPALGVRLFERDWPQDPGSAGGTPVVLVHGLGLSSRYMVPFGRRLAALGHQVLAPDLPGFGRSRKPKGARWPAGPSVREQADHRLAWMGARGVTRAVLFGDSIGAQVAVEVAVRAPERVERLVLKGASPDPAYRTPLKQYSRVLRNMPFELPSLRGVFQVEYATTGVPRMVQQLRRTVDDPIEERLPRVAAPALVVRGRYDQTLSQEWAEQFTRLLPDGRLVVVEGAAHNVHYTAPHLTARLVHAFLEGELDAASALDGDQVVVPGSTRGADPLAPRELFSTRVHGVADYATAAACLTVPRAMPWGPRTRRLLAAVGLSAATYSALTQYELGVVKKIPMTVHLNIDVTSGLQLLLASVTLLRREPLAGRCAVAALGAFEVLAGTLTRAPTGPARLVPARASRT
jgi:pimeloyl-ACP methyl ester carboxylesterase